MNIIKKNDNKIIFNNKIYDNPTICLFKLTKDCEIDENIINKLIEYRANVNYTDKKNRSSLTNAYFCNTRIINNLLQNGGDYNKKIFNGLNLLEFDLNKKSSKHYIVKFHNEKIKIILLAIKYDHRSLVSHGAFNDLIKLIFRYYYITA